MTEPDGGAYSPWMEDLRTRLGRSFPPRARTSEREAGGGVSDRDTNLWETAIRETEEEIGVPRSSVRLLGALPKLETVTDFEVSPFVGAIPYPVAFVPHAGEVESIIEVPMAYLLDPMVVEERAVKWKGRDVLTLVYHYKGHAIWGATARILTDLLAVMRADEGSGSLSVRKEPSGPSP